MRLFRIVIVLSILTLFGFTETNPERIAVKQIKELKKGVLLVRLHTNDAVTQKLKDLHRDKDRMIMMREIRAENLNVYKALTTMYKFSEIQFFFSRDSDKIKARKYENVFLDSELEMDTSIVLNANLPIFILDVGDIHFEHMSGHMEGVAILNEKFEQLADPFPYFVRKRSGMVIIRRTDLDIARILDKNLTAFFAKNKLKDVG